MKNNNSSNGQSQLKVFAAIPFIVAIFLLVISLATLTDISLLPPFSINVIAVIGVFLIQLLVILIFAKWKKIDLIRSKINPFAQVVRLIMITIFFLVSSFLLVVGLKMNLNYWLRSDSMENIEIEVVDKYITYGKGSTFYVLLACEKGKFQKEVSAKSYDAYDKGEVFNVPLSKGYFEGYFLTKKLK